MKTDMFEKVPIPANLGVDTCVTGPEENKFKALELIRAFREYLPFIVTEGMAGSRKEGYVTFNGPDSFIDKDGRILSTPDRIRVLSDISKEWNIAINREMTSWYPEPKRDVSYLRSSSDLISYMVYEFRFRYQSALLELGVDRIKKYDDFISSCTAMFEKNTHQLFMVNSTLVPSIFNHIIERISICLEVSEDKAIGLLLEIDPNEINKHITHLAIGINGSIGQSLGGLGNLITPKWVKDTNKSKIELLFDTDLLRARLITIRIVNDERAAELKKLYDLSENLKPLGYVLLIKKERILHIFGWTGLCPVIYGENTKKNDAYLPQILLAMELARQYLKLNKK